MAKQKQSQEEPSATVAPPVEAADPMRLVTVRNKGAHWNGADYHRDGATSIGQGEAGRVTAKRAAMLIEDFPNRFEIVED